MPRIQLCRRRTLLFAMLTIAAGVVTISACSSEENPPAGTLSLALSPTSVNIAPGGSGTVAATITRGGSFTGPVTLSATGNPTGVAVTFTPVEILGPSTTSTVNIAVGDEVPPGDKTITISAEGDNVTTATATLTVVVVAGGAGSISLEASPATLNLTAGAAALTSTITITRTAPFVGAVGFTVSGAPAGVTATMSPVSAAGETSTLSVSATASAVNGTYPLVVRGAGVGIADATVPVNATVSGGSTAGASFTFAPNPLPMTAGGASATSTVTIARTGSFAPSGALSLALSGAPAGLTVSVAPSTNVTGTTATVTAQASGAVTPGTYDIVLTGTGTGIPNATATLPVVVSASGGGGNFNVTFCAADAPIWVAQQDGSGAWTRVTGSGTGGLTYQFSLASGSGGVAFVVPDGATSTDLNVVYASAAEFGALGGTANLTDCGSKTVNGTVANVGATEVSFISLGFSSATVLSVSPGFPAFVLNNVSDGAQDLVASRIDQTTFTANSVIIRRGLNVAAGGSLAALDFNAAEAFVPGTANVTVSGLGADEAALTSTFTGAYGSRTSGALSLIESYTAASGAQPFSAVPGTELAANELNQLSAFAPDAANDDAIRIAGVYFGAPANQTVTMGPAMSTPTVTKVVTSGIARPRVQLTSQAQYDRLISTGYQQGSARFVNVFATADYFSGLPATWDVTVPDLSGAAGWTPAWGLQDGTPITWDVSVDGGAIQFLDYNSITSGTSFRSATVSSSTPLAIRAARSDPFAMQRRLADALRRQTKNPLY